MAFQPLIPFSASITVTQGIAQAFQMPVINNLSGSPVDLSAWTAMVAKIIPPTPAPTGTDVAFGTVTANNAGVTTITTGSSDLASVPPGSAQLRVYGKPTSGDALQLMGTGSVTVQAA